MNINIFSQNTFEPETYDYLNHDYKYLNSDYKIQMDSLLYEETIDKYKYYRERINNYKDSLSIALIAEFDDTKKVIMAKNILTYPWEKVGFHIWLSPEEAEKLGKEYKFEHPYQLQNLLYYPNGDEKIETIIKKLRNELKLKFPDKPIDDFDNPRFLIFAFRKNPDVIKAREDFMQKRLEEIRQKKEQKLKDAESEKTVRNKSGCGAENCCSN